MPERLVDRNPVVPADHLVEQMSPPPMFDEVSFDSYIPDPDEPTQARAVEAAAEFAGTVAGLRRGGKRGLFGRKKAPATGVGLYLDGGFGVGKTHLLASIYHSCPGPKTFGTFVELTHLVGALGFNNTVEQLSGNSVLCIDEFELDDPGDTMLVSRLLTELTARGVSIAATSNTLPGQLGEGRFAAQDFLREIKKLSAIFETIRVDGPDYRHRDLPPAPPPTEPDELVERAEATPGLPSTTSTNCSTTSPPCTPRATRSCSRASARCSSRTCTRSTTRPSRCGSSSSPTVSTTPASPSSCPVRSWTNCSPRR